MKIRTQFIITMLLFGIILVVIAGSAIIMDRRVEKTDRQESLAANIALGASEISYLANDYLIYRENQQLSRWQSRFASFSKQVAGLTVEKPEHQMLVRNIQTNQKRLKEVFNTLVSVPETPTRDQGIVLDLSLFQVSWSRLAVQSQALISDASRLSRLLDQQKAELTNKRTSLIYSMVGLLGLFLLSSYLLTYRRILKSFAALQAGTAIIGSGDLNFKIEEIKHDEIGELAAAFNRMTTDLKNVTASKGDLEREITQRKQAEEVLRQGREWLRVTISSIGDAVIACDKEGRITFLNPIAATLTGWQPDQALGQPITRVFSIINERTQLPAEDLVARVLREKQVLELANDTALLTQDGRAIPIEDSAAPILDDAGRVLGAVLVFHDVTAKRQTQQTLREAHDKAIWLARFPDENPNPVLRASFDGIILYHNPACSKLWGWKSRVGQPLENELRSLVDLAMAERGEVQQDIQFGGRSYIIWVVAFPEEGYVNLYGRDVTERKRAEEALKKAHEELERRVEERTLELAKANEALRNLSSKLLSAQEEERKRVAGEIHDTLGSSLVGIKFKVEKAMKEIEENPQAAGLSLNTTISVIQESIEECRRIQQDLRPAIIDYLGLLPTLSWFCRRFQAIYSNILIEQEIGIEEDEIPDALKIVLFRIVQEAMNNIAKHSQAGLVHLCLRKIGTRMELVIEDNGGGFDLTKVRTLANTEKGLGLTSMRERTELSGGSFGIESRAGKGTTIRAWWPLPEEG